MHCWAGFASGALLGVCLGVTRSKCKNQCIRRYFLFCVEPLVSWIVLSCALVEPESGTCKLEHEGVRENRAVYPAVLLIFSVNWTPCPTLS